MSSLPPPPSPTHGRTRACASASSACPSAARFPLAPAPACRRTDVSSPDLRTHREEVAALAACPGRNRRPHRRKNPAPTGGEAFSLPTMTGPNGINHGNRRPKRRTPVPIADDDSHGAWHPRSDTLIPLHALGHPRGPRQEGPQRGPVSDADRPGWWHGRERRVGHYRGPLARRPRQVSYIFRNHSH